MKKYFSFFVLALFLFYINCRALTKSPIDVTKMSIYDLQEAMTKGYVTSETLVKLYLERIEAYDEMFNSINTINEKAIEQARLLDEEREAGKVRGKLHGIPILVKCNIDVYGLPTSAGTKALKDNYPMQNAFAIQKLIDEGAIILGSTNMSEMAFSAANSYSSYGYVRNVFDVSYTSYGSSGGSAVAVKAGFAAASLGTDTNSSVRLPAAGAGLVGMRPTLGLVSRTGVIPYDIERDTIGVLTRTVLDNTLLLSIISGSDEKDKATVNTVKSDFKIDKKDLNGITIGVPTQYTQGKKGTTGVTSLTDPDIYELVQKSLKVLEERGAKLVYLDNFVKSSNLTIASSTQSGITMCDNFNEYIKGTTGTIRSFEQLAKSSGHVYGLSGYVKGCGGSYSNSTTRDNKKSSYRDYVDNYFREYNLDVIIYPTLKNKPYQYNKTGNISPGSSLGSVIGYPSITVPMGYDESGFAYGIEFLSQAYLENDLYNIAYVFEQGNGNVVDTSPLTPPLYEIPDEVKILKDVYEEMLAMENRTDIVDLQNEIKMFFINYNEYEDVSSKANEFIERYENLKGKGTNSNKGVINVLFILLPILVFFVMFREFFEKS